MKKKILCSILLACMLVLPGCSKESELAAPELLTPVGVSMDTAVVEKADIERKYKYVGVVEPEVQELYFEMDGLLEEVKVHYGDTVKEGDILAVLEQEELEEQVEDLEGQIAYKQQINTYKNQQLQYDISICQVELNQMQANGADNSQIQLKKLDLEEKNLNLAQARETQKLELDQLNSQLAKLREELGTNTLVAPCDGTVVYMGNNVAEGKYVSAFDPVMYIANDNELYISCEEVGNSTIEFADEMYAKIGDKEYAVTLQPYDREEYMALLLSGGDVKSRFAIDNIDDSVEAGDYVVLIISTMRSEDTLVIPANALYADEMGSFVYKMVDGYRERCAVETGLITDLEAQILSGLEEGDEVYVQE